MTCHELIDLADDYLAGEVPPETRAAFEEHLAACASCAAYLESLRLTIDLAHLDTAEIELLPDELVRAILAARRKSR